MRQLHVLYFCRLWRGGERRETSGRPMQLATSPSITAFHMRIVLHVEVGRCQVLLVVVRNECPSIESINAKWHCGVQTEHDCISYQVRIVYVK